MKMRRIVLVAVMVLFAGSVRGAAAQDAIRLAVSNGLKASMEKLQAQCEQAVGRKLAMEFNSTAGLKAKMDQGTAFDAMLITKEAIDDLVKQGKAAGASRTAIGRSPLVIGIRAGASRADIHDADAFKRALLQAKSITYPRDGASRPHLDKTFVQLGIADALKPKIVLAESSGTATESVAKGQAEMVMTLASETAPVPGIEVLGPFPGGLAYEIHFDGVASTGTTQGDLVRKLLTYLTGPQATTVFRANGVEAPVAGK
jgi:molybdate transport system substrate-binding protein